MSFRGDRGQPAAVIEDLDIGERVMEQYTDWVYFYLVILY
jgi:hypothetical protein